MLEVKDTLSINSPPSPLPDLPCNIISNSSVNHTISHCRSSTVDGDLDLGDGPKPIKGQKILESRYIMLPW